METKNVLVVGGAGYIGAQCCKHLSARGWRPVCFDNFSTGHREFVKWGPCVEGDLTDGEAVEAALADHHPAAVMHFAACSLVGESVENPAKYYRNNVGGTLNLIEAMLRHGVRSLVFSSTCAVYGEPKIVPIPEEHPLEPVNPYGRSKAAIEGMLKDFERAHGLKFAALRYFNAAGADPDADIGEDHDPETHLIPLVLEAAAGRRSHVDIFGDDYPTRDGTCVRDYVHVADLAEAHGLALERLLERETSFCVNLGNGEGATVREVIAMAAEVTGLQVPLRIADRREGDPPRLIAGAGLARELLGWQPCYPNLATILEHAWAWHRKRFHPD